MIRYFSGTGGSRYVAESLAKLLGDDDVDSIFAGASPNADCDMLGIVFPVYGWRPPRIMERYLSHIPAPSAPGRYTFIVMVCGDDCGKALREARRAAGCKIDAAFSATMPNTYVSLPLFDVDSAIVRRRKYAAAVRRISEIAKKASQRECLTDIHEGILPWTKTYVLGRIIRPWLTRDDKFRAGEGCTSCGACARECPVGNIALPPGSESRPVWGGGCTGCLACYHACPHHAIEWGGMTARKGQYNLRRYREELGEAEKEFYSK